MGTREEEAAKLAEFQRKLIKYGKIAGAAILTLILVFSSYSEVGPGERGIRVTLGKTGQEVLGEGPHFKMPFFGEIRTMSIRVKKSEDSANAATKDMQQVKAIVALNWTINPQSVGNMLREVGDESSIENNIIAPAVAEVLKAATSKMTAEEVLTKRMELKHNIDEQLIARLTAYGLVIKDINLVDLDFTKEFNHAVEQKQIAEQQAKQAEYVAQKATQDAVAMVNAAKGEADALLLNATAQAKAQNLLRMSLTKDVLALEYLKKWNGVLPQVQTGSGSGIMFNLPATAAQ